MKTKITFTLLAFLLTLTVSAQEQPVTLKTKTGNIEGTFAWPAQQTKAPLVLIIAGSGPTDRNGNNPQMKNNSLKMLSDSLVKNGIATLRFDKRGIAASASAGTKEADLRFETYINDVKEWINQLSADKRLTRIIIAGHSEGSLIGIVAAQSNPKVQAFISIAGAGFPADEILKRQLDPQPQAVKSMIFPMIDQLKRGDTIANVSPMFYSLFRPSVQRYMISWMRYNPQTEIAKLTIPILILQGDKDIQVSLADAGRLAQSAPAAQKCVIVNMNHVLKTCATTDQAAQIATYTNPDLPVSQELVKEVVEFAKRPIK